jgi:hypothetical protein
MCTAQIVAVLCFLLHLCRAFLVRLSDTFSMIFRWFQLLLLLLVSVLSLNFAAVFLLQDFDILNFFRIILLTNLYLLEL